MTYKIIGAGFGRTGTLSMKAALEQLGFDPCYHMAEVCWPRPGCNDGHLDAWYDFYVNDKPMDWGWLMRSYQASVDFPTCLHYRELMEAFPDAVVILTTRDADKWFDSFESLWSAVQSANVPEKIVRFHKWMPMLDAMADKYLQGRPVRETHTRIFREHIDAVRRDVPANKLLEFSVTEGWGPLCEFLGVDVPDTPFPHLNERAGIGDLLQRMMWTDEAI